LHMFLMHHVLIDKGYSVALQFKQLLPQASITISGLDTHTWGRSVYWKFCDPGRILNQYINNLRF
jgi:hypothetical protein